MATLKKTSVSTKYIQKKNLKKSSSLIQADSPEPVFYLLGIWFLGMLVLKEHAAGSPKSSFYVK